MSSIYIVRDNCGSNFKFLVKAKNKREAINQVWEAEIEPINEGAWHPWRKKDFYAEKLDANIIDEGVFKL